MTDTIARYITTLRRELSFDPALADRLAAEVEGHLRDAAEAERDWPSPHAEARAIARFGLAHEIAAQFAADAVERQARRAWLVVPGAIVVTLAAMRLRVIWLDDGSPLSLLPLVDRYAFSAAVAAAIVGWCAFRRALAPLALCVAALAASVAAGFARAADLIADAPLHVVLAAAGEVLLIGLLALHVAGLALRLRRTALVRRTNP